MELFRISYTALNILLAISISHAQDEVPSPETFLRRGNSRASVIGDYIYFNGGGVSQMGYVDFENFYPANATLSIYLGESWTPSGVRFTETPNAPAMLPIFKHDIFTDNSSGIFYIWGGHTSPETAIDEPVLWSFLPNGRGGGSWTADSSGLRDIERGEGSAYVSTEDAGFSFGGISNALTSLEPKGSMAGYAIFNFTTREWSREQSAPYTTDESLYGGTAIYAPDFGRNGLIFVLGGLTNYKEENEEYATFRTVYFLDPVTREWQSQITSGDAPTGRFFHCAAGVSSVEGTFEIFVFGGKNRAAGTDYSDLFVLTLPGFRWTKVTGLETSPRRDHICLPLGNRQFLSWGGLDADSHELADDSLFPDPFPQGIGIFDMTALEWASGYDASADAYESHTSIQEWYNQGGMDTVDWSSDEVRQLFMQEHNEGSGSNNGSETDGGSNTTPPLEDDPKTKPSSTPVGSIIGAVIGSVVGVALILLGIWVYRRRRHAKEHVELPQLKNDAISPTELMSRHLESKPQELSGVRDPQELSPVSRPTELPNLSMRQEMSRI